MLSPESCFNFRVLGVRNSPGIFSPAKSGISLGSWHQGLALFNTQLGLLPGWEQKMFLASDTPARSVGRSLRRGSQ